MRSFEIARARSGGRGFIVEPLKRGGIYPKQRNYYKAIVCKTRICLRPRSREKKWLIRQEAEDCGDNEARYRGKVGGILWGLTKMCDVSHNGLKKREYEVGTYTQNQANT